MRNVIYDLVTNIQPLDQLEKAHLIRCYEKAGFKPIRKDHDGTEEVIILEKRGPTCSV